MVSAATRYRKGCFHPDVTYPRPSGARRLWMPVENAFASSRFLTRFSIIRGCASRDCPRAKTTLITPTLRRQRGKKRRRASCGVHDAGTFSGGDNPREFHIFQRPGLVLMRNIGTAVARRATVINGETASIERFLFFFFFSSRKYTFGSLVSE